ncbi:uncharacterized protein LOC142357311, partial [Convolutriloba macropyga]|uniref:uncharacterized protein LOC142357311 n=1 Tax=Convolutriloba macropyga TaxID=536237 RepID=UPI003F522DD2
MAFLFFLTAVSVAFCSLADAQFTFNIQCYDCAGSSSDDTLSYCQDTPGLFDSTACVGSCQIVTTYDTNEISSVLRRCYPSCEERDDRNSQTGS